MKYLSFFSGIGGFELALDGVNSKCIGFSEIDDKALDVYKKHFPEHAPMELGDIAKISNKTIKEVVKRAGGCDLIVGGFPCQNLTSYGYTMNVGNGLDGEKSGLFFELLRIIKSVLTTNPNLHIILENNASMKHSERAKITAELRNVFGNGKRLVHMSVIDSGDIGVQRRRRIFWTTFPVGQPTKKIQTWNSVLDPIKSTATFKPMSPELIAYLNSPCSLNKNYSKAKMIAVKNKDGTYVFKPSAEATRWYLKVSNTTDKNAKPIVRVHSFLNDYRGLPNNSFVPRYYSPKELCRLFGFPVKFAKGLSHNQALLLFGNCVVVHVVKHVLGFMPAPSPVPHKPRVLPRKPHG